MASATPRGGGGHTRAAAAAVAELERSGELTVDTGAAAGCCMPAFRAESKERQVNVAPTHPAGGEIRTEG